MYCEAQFQEKVKSRKDGSKRRCSTIFTRDAREALGKKAESTLCKLHVSAKT
jgi:hypothetical protein